MFNTLLTSLLSNSRCLIRNSNIKKTFYSTQSMDLRKLVQRLNEYANKDLACDWDNVGLLVEPSDSLQVKRVLVTNDLTEAVLNEAISLDVNLILSYHPAIFKPLKKLTQTEWKERSIVKCIEKRIAVYSPHTTWDSVDGGMNDWLINVFNPKTVQPVTTIQSTTLPTVMSKSIKVNLKNTDEKDKLLKDIKGSDNIRYISDKDLNGNENGIPVEVELVASANGIIKLTDILKTNYDASVFSTLRIVDLQKPHLKNAGLGRYSVLKEPLTINQVIEKLKEATKLQHVRLALANGKTRDDIIKSIAIGAGSCSDLLNNTNADLIISGEFKHHEILHETHRGVSVILTDHTNTERCYFNYFKQAFTQLLNKNGDPSVEILISKVDRDPLEVV